MRNLMFGILVLTLLALAAASGCGGSDTTDAAADAAVDANKDAAADTSTDAAADTASDAVDASADAAGG